MRKRMISFQREGMCIQSESQELREPYSGHMTAVKGTI
jgi:hypothetical protein